MRVCTTYGSEVPLRKEAAMHEVRMDVFGRLPEGLNDESIITLCGTSIKKVPERFGGLVDVGDSDVNTELRTIKSVHDYTKTPKCDDIVSMMKGGNHISKGAFAVNSFTDLHSIYAASKKMNSRHVLVGMGTTGTITRIRSDLLGNEFTYGYHGTPTAKGQLTAEELERLGWDCTVVGIVGRELSHSKSPAMHDAAMASAKINGKYLTFESPDLAHLEDVMREYLVRGVNVTIPFKEKVMEHLDGYSKQCGEIGAANTVVNDDGRLTGENTDVIGIENALSKVMGNIERALILGSGGAARATAYVFSEKGKDISVAGRNQKTASKLKRDFGGEEFTGNAGDYDIVVNCTPIGFVEGGYPADMGNIRKGSLVFDMVYGVRTVLMETAIKKGCVFIDGKDMLVSQGAESFRLWFGREPNVDAMREAIGW